MGHTVFLAVGVASGLAIVAQESAVSAGYDPLAVNPDFHAAYVDLTVHDALRHREIPLRVYLPANHRPEPVILFSHGLGGSKATCAYLGEHWAARGYVAIFLQHPGSDDSVWKNAAVNHWMESLQAAASLDNFLLRVRDVTAVLDQLELWGTNATGPLAGRLDLKHVGMSGHSFGAVTTQAVSGERLPVSGEEFRDPRIKAAVALSPSAPRQGDVAKAFGNVMVPWMLMTGTRDVAPIGDQDVTSRLSVYPALRGAPKFEVVLDKAEHSAFTDRPLPGDREPRNPNHHRVILALSTAFWDAYLRGDAAALAWLTGPGPRSMLEPADRWQFARP